MSEAAIEVQGIETRFGEKVVHDHVSFTVDRGSIVGLIGGSGSGKTVLLREMIGLHKPNAGSVKLLGHDIVEGDEEETAKIRKRLGVMFQSGALFSALTVRENIAVPMLEEGTVPKEILDEIVNLRLILSGLKIADGDKMPSELSGGMTKRAAIARALSLEPEILLLDEPTSGLDPINARAVDSLTKTLAEALGITVLIVTHDVLTLRAIADKIVALYEGKVLIEGSYDEVSKKDHPWLREYFARA